MEFLPPERVYEPVVVELQFDRLLSSQNSATHSMRMRRSSVSFVFSLASAVMAFLGVGRKT